MDGDVKIFPDRRIGGAMLAPGEFGVNGGAALAPLWRHPPRLPSDGNIWRQAGATTSASASQSGFAGLPPDFGVGKWLGHCV